MADKFDEASQKELSKFLENEQAQARVQSTIHQLTSTCWDKCITGTPASSFSKSERGCLENCVDRFLDTSLFLINKIQEQRDASFSG
ncbi:Tim10/DDP family zinc finger-domain-containing protein [Abortiporus biennis]|nr:Tim10/DDP family zinc finger-domain-containing protein [Abortiporus biennis]